MAIAISSDENHLFDQIVTVFLQCCPTSQLVAVVGTNLDLLYRNVSECFRQKILLEFHDGEGEVRPDGSLAGSTSPAEGNGGDLVLPCPNTAGEVLRWAALVG